MAIYKGNGSIEVIESEEKSLERSPEVIDKVVTVHNRLNTQGYTVVSSNENHIIMKKK